MQQQLADNEKGGRCTRKKNACNRYGDADFLYKIDQVRQELLMKTIRHTVNVPSQMEKLLSERIQDYRSLSSYFVSLGFTDALYLPKRPNRKSVLKCELATARESD
jgi:hypothetical protein